MRKGLFGIALIAGWIGSSLPGAIPAAAEEEAPETAVSSPPMEMDDPGTPGPNGIEVNFVGSVERLGPGRISQGLLDANYGIGERIQLKYERPWVTTHESGASIQSGLGATEIGVKWRFVDRHEWQVGFYPQYQFDDGFTLKDGDGNPKESEGRSVYFPLLISRGLGRNYTLAANYGYRKNLDHRGDDSNVALGVGRALGMSARVLAEVFSERDESFRNRQTDARIGVFFTPRAFSSGGFEWPVYASLGHSLGSTEAGENSTSFTLGFSLIRKPKE